VAEAPESPPTSGPARRTRAAAVAHPPAGLVYRNDLLAPDEERDLTALFEELELEDVTMHGQVARRRVRHFGFDYAYETRGLAPGEPLPEQLLPLRGRSAELARVDPGALAQTLVSWYPEGAGIGWHRDAAPFGIVVGISLGAPCRLRLRRGEGPRREQFAVDLEPRSAYVLAGEARTAWQHSIPPVTAPRWSVTFRTLRNPGRWAAAGS
jgi:alkylated DNA repair dioxygenase AlkB